jgi:hypothetical protein
VWIDYGYLNPYIEPVNVIRSETLGPSVIFDWGWAHDGMVLEVAAADTGDSPIVNSSGDVTIGTIVFATSGFAADTVTGTAPVSLPIVYNQVWGTVVGGDSIPTASIYRDNGLVFIAPLDGDLVVNFPDTMLEMMVREYSGANVGDIHLRDCLTITSMTFPDYYNPVYDLTGIEYCHNLQSLYMADQGVSDATPLAGLARLSTLNLSRNPLTDIGPLAELYNLGELRLSGNGITDASPLAGLRGLWTLDLYYNQISSCAFLTEMDNMYELYLGSNDISDISPIANCRYVSTLDLSYNTNLSDISALAGLTYIYSLNLNYCGITDIAPLVQNTGLGTGDYLYLTGNPLDATSQDVYIPLLRQRGVNVSFGV